MPASRRRTFTLAHGPSSEPKSEALVCDLHWAFPQGFATDWVFFARNQTTDVRKGYQQHLPWVGKVRERMCCMICSLHVDHTFTVPGLGGPVMVTLDTCSG